MLTSYQKITISIQRRHRSHLSMIILYLLCVGCIEGQVDPDVDRDEREERAMITMEMSIM